MGDESDWRINRMLDMKDPVGRSKPKKKKKVESHPILQRGYSHVRERFEKGSKFLMSCTNCGYYYQAVGDREEVCQNTDVLEYDMVVDGNRIYCLRWSPLRTRSDSNAKSDRDGIREQRTRGIFKNPRAKTL